MRQLYVLSTLIVALLLTAGAQAQTWPVTFSLEGGDRLKLYEPQPSNFKNNELSFQSAVALYRKNSNEPVFGTVWANAVTQQQGSNEKFARMTVSNIRFPAEIETSYANNIARSMEKAVDQQPVLVSREQLTKALELNQQKEKLAGDLNNRPPKVVFKNKPSLMVIIDGNPIWKKNEQWGLEAVVNTPNTVVKGTDGRVYVYGGKYWYGGNSLQQSLTYVANPSEQLNSIANQLAEAAKKQADNDDDENDFNNEFEEEEDALPVAEVLVSTEPAELIQSKGEANFSPVQNTQLLYVENSPNDIFMDVPSQQYYVLLSGRWYRSASLSGNWQYIGADQLPDDFSRIPAGSEKDNVLASVAGTPAAENAKMDAQLPQTAKVDRNSATASVEYDGQPQFQKIDGTKMEYAVNTSATVIRYKRKYFMVDNGVWFQSASASGPWAASTERPDEVDLIPANNPVYPVKYVYIYDVTPEYIYTGYTPGYLNTFVYGPTVVYGTGFYYRPWFGSYYYPRPYTWGFNMHYTPWYGWSMGFNYNPGWFHVGFGYRPWNYWHGGWWGPSAYYRPAYCPPMYRRHGYYGYRNNTLIVNNYYGRNRGNYRYNNVYRSRPSAIVSRDTRRYNNYNSYNNRNGANRGGNNAINRPNRSYGNNNNREYNNRNREFGNRPNRTYGSNNNGSSNGSVARPNRTYRPEAGNNRPEGRRPQTGNTRPSQRPINSNRPSAERAERRERPAISREQRQATPQREVRRPAPSRQEVRRESPSRPSGGGREARGGGQRGGGGGGRPERRGN